MDIAIIRDEISLLTRNPVEADVRAFWHMVLREYFPSSEGYVVKDEAPNKFGISDIIVYEHRRTLGGTLIQHCFLVVQCKRVSFETQDSVWAEAELMDLGDEHNLRLWMMVFSPIQQALQLDVGLYTATIIWRNDGNLEFFG